MTYYQSGNNNLSDGLPEPAGSSLSHSAQCVEIAGPLSRKALMLGATLF